MSPEGRPGQICKETGESFAEDGDSGSISVCRNHSQRGLGMCSNWRKEVHSFLRSPPSSPSLWVRQEEDGYRLSQNPAAPSSVVMPHLSAVSQGKCDSKAVYSIDTEDVQGQCSCCWPSRTEPMRVPLHCTNGSVVYHEVINAMECRCSPRNCSK